MDFSIKRNLFFVLIFLTVLTTSASFVLGNFTDQVAGLTVQNNTQQELVPLPPPQKLANPPEIINAVYVTGWSAGSSKYLAYLANLFNDTEINAVVVDIKDYSGFISYDSQAEEVKKYNLYSGAIKDIDSLVRFFHDKNIYVIGRISVFEDPGYSKARPDVAIYNKVKTKDKISPVLWKDNNGLTWLDPSSKDVWDYNISLAKDVLSHGFDEINFDYIRFPSDGKTENMGFPVWSGKTKRAQVINEFFSYLRQELPDEKISADVFGQTTVNKDDMGIGQIIENTFGTFDYVSPMIYPSHYIKGFIGFDNPAKYPYEVIKYSMDKALAKQNKYISSNLPANELEVGVPQKIAKFRPWIQDFNMGAVYNTEMVKSEIQALKDSLGKEYYGFMLWSPSNIYTRGAVSK